MINSPFNISFGEIPMHYISRKTEFEEIASVFGSDHPESKIMIITGPRGSGKTVLLSSIKNHFECQKKWITIDVNPNDDILEQIAAKLFETGKLKKLFTKAEFNFSFQGIGFSIHGEEPISNIYSLLEKMIKYLKNKNYRLLLTIDDVSSNDFMKIFAHTYQSYLREGYDVFLLMTGLYENIEKISNAKNLTFLARSPKLYLDKLNMREIAFSYRDIFNIDLDDAIRLAKQTNGYAYGYQLLGSILYKNNKTKIDNDVLSKYDLFLDDNSYSLIWKELSTNEKNILKAVSKTDGNIKNIIAEANITNSALQVYKTALYKKGIIDTSLRGKIGFNLPRFKEFVDFQIQFEEA